VISDKIVRTESISSRSRSRSNGIVIGEGDVGCTAGVAVSSSVLSIAVLSADRLLAVRRPLSFRIYRASRHAWIIVAAVWLTSLALAAPLLHVRRIRSVDLGFGGPQNVFDFCHEANSSHVLCHVRPLISYECVKIFCLNITPPREDPRKKKLR